MKKLIPVIAVAALTLTACGGGGSDDPVTDTSIYGMDRSEAIIECQKHVADQTPGLKLSDFDTVGSSGIRQVRDGDTYHWNVQGEQAGRAYICNVYPAEDGSSTIDGAFAP